MTDPTPPGPPGGPKGPSDGGTTFPWGDETDAEIARVLAGLRARYCPECRENYGCEDERCPRDGVLLRDRSIFATRVVGEVYDASTFSYFFEQACPRCGESFAGSLTHCPDDGATLQPRRRPGAPHEEPDPEQMVGKIFGGKWRITAFLSPGGFGWVYRGEGLGLGQPVAVKLLKINLADSPRYRELFHAEATILSGLDDPRIVRVIDYGEEDETPYLVMHLLAGTPLNKLADKEELTIRDKAEIMRQVAMALAAAHREDPGADKRRVVHLDLKPEHVFVRRQEQEIHVTVIDFGIAEIMTGSEGEGRKASLVGTPAYMAGERFDGEIDPRCDIYSFGVIFYELLAGRKPFPGPDRAEVAGDGRPSGHAYVSYFEHHHKEVPPPPLRKDAKGRKIPRPLRRLARRALAKRREDRPQSAAELAREIQVWLARKWLGRFLLRATLALVLFLIAFLAYRYIYPPGAGMDVPYNGPEGQAVLYVRIPAEGARPAPFQVQVRGLAAGEAQLDVDGKPFGGAVPFDEANPPRFDVGSLSPGTHDARIRARRGLRRVPPTSFRLILDRDEPRIRLVRRKGLLEPDESAGPDSYVLDPKAEKILVIVEEENLKELRTNISDYLPRLSSRDGPRHTYEIPLGLVPTDKRVVVTALPWVGLPVQRTFRFDRCRSPRLASLKPEDGEVGKQEPEEDPTDYWTAATELLFRGRVYEKPGAVRVLRGGVGPPENVPFSPHPSERDTFTFSARLEGLEPRENPLTFVVTDRLGHEAFRKEVVVHVAATEGRLEPAWEDGAFRIRSTTPFWKVEKDDVEVTRSQNERGERIDAEPFDTSMKVQGLDLWIRTKSGVPFPDGRYQITVVRALDEFGRRLSGDWPLDIDRASPRIELQEEGVFTDGLGSADHPIRPEDGSLGVRLRIRDVSEVDAWLEFEDKAKRFPLARDEDSGDPSLFSCRIPYADLAPFLGAWANRARIVAHERRGPSTVPRDGEPTTAPREFTIYADRWEGPEEPAILSIEPDEEKLFLHAKVRVVVDVAPFAGAVRVNGEPLKRQPDPRPGEKRFAGLVSSPRDGDLRVEARCANECDDHRSERIRHILVRPREGETVSVRDDRGRAWPMVYMECGRRPEQGILVSSVVSSMDYDLFILGEYLGEGGLAFRTCLDPSATEPASGIRRHDAEAFCRRLGEGFRLPTEAEWEAMRAVDEAKIQGWDAKALEAVRERMTRFGDFNRDTLLDMVVANRSPGTLTLFAGEGDGTFTKIGTIGAGQDVEAILVTDLDGDGVDDVLVTNADPGLYVALNLAGRKR